MPKGGGERELHFKKEGRLMPGVREGALHFKKEGRYLQPKGYLTSPCQITSN